MNRFEKMMFKPKEPVRQIQTTGPQWATVPKEKSAWEYNSSSENINAISLGLGFPAGLVLDVYGPPIPSDYGLGGIGSMIDDARFHNLMNRIETPSLGPRLNSKEQEFLIRRSYD